MLGKSFFDNQQALAEAALSLTTRYQALVKKLRDIQLATSGALVTNYGTGICDSLGGRSVAPEFESAFGLIKKGALDSHEAIVQFSDSLAEEFSAAMKVYEDSSVTAFEKLLDRAPVGAEPVVAGLRLVAKAMRTHNEVASEAAAKVYKAAESHAAAMTKSATEVVESGKSAVTAAVAVMGKAKAKQA